MSRCTRTRNLEVHHIRRDGGNGLDNAKVLCQPCHANTTSYGTQGNSPEPFSQETKDKALKRSGYQCECVSNSGCH